MNQQINFENYALRLALNILCDDCIAQSSTTLTVNDNSRAYHSNQGFLLRLPNTY